MYCLLYRRPNTATVSKQNQMLLKSFDAVIRNREKLMARGFETIVYKNNKVVNFDKELTKVALDRMKAMGHTPNMASKDETDTLVQIAYEQTPEYQDRVKEALDEALALSEEAEASEKDEKVDVKD